MINSTASLCTKDRREAFQFGEKFNGVNEPASKWAIGKSLDRTA